MRHYDTTTTTGRRKGAVHDKRDGKAPRRVSYDRLQMARGGKPESLHTAQDAAQVHQRGGDTASMGRRLDKAVTAAVLLMSTLGYSLLGVLILLIAAVQIVCHLSVTTLIMSTAAMYAGLQLIIYGVDEYNNETDND